MDVADALTEGVALQPLVASLQAGALSAEEAVKQALEHKDVYVFGELLDVPAVQALAQSAPALYRALQVFAFGVYREYVQDASLPALTEAQRKKLRLLTVVTLAQKSHVRVGACSE